MAIDKSCWHSFLLVEALQNNTTVKCFFTFLWQSHTIFSIPPESQNICFHSHGTPATSASNSVGVPQTFPQLPLDPWVPVILIHVLHGVLYNTYVIIVWSLTNMKGWIYWDVFHAFCDLPLITRCPANNRNTAIRQHDETCWEMHSMTRAAPAKKKFTILH